MVESFFSTEQARKLAQELRRRLPIVVQCVLKVMAKGNYEDVNAGLKTKEEGAVLVRKTKDCEEGFKAFLEKRHPVFLVKQKELG